MTSKTKVADTATPKTAAIADDLHRNSDEHRSAEAELVRLEAARAGLLLTVPDKELEAHDSLIAKTKRRIERATAMHCKLAADLQAAEAAEEQQRRRAVYARAEQAAEEYERLHREEYSAAAAALAAILRKMKPLRDVVAEANATLPDATAPIDEDFFRAKGATRSRYEQAAEPYFVDRHGNEVMPEKPRPAEPRETTVTYTQHREVQIRVDRHGKKVHTDRAGNLVDENGRTVDPHECSWKTVYVTDPAPRPDTSAEIDRQLRFRPVRKFVPGARGDRPSLALVDAVKLPGVAHGDKAFWE